MSKRTMNLHVHYKLHVYITLFLLFKFTEAGRRGGHTEVVPRPAEGAPRRGLGPVRHRLRDMVVTNVRRPPRPPRPATHKAVPVSSLYRYSVRWIQCKVHVAYMNQIK